MDVSQFMNQWNDASDSLPVHTSGSTGQPKTMWAEKRRMEASARATLSFLGIARGDTALLCLPLDYIAGKMMVVRSVVGGLRLVSVPADGHPMRTVDTHIDLAAMVPLQVYNSLRSPDERRRLMQVRHLIIGGGAIPPDMERQLAGFPNHVWSTYGMTETLSHVAMRRLNGPQASPWYEPLPTVGVSLSAEGCLVVSAPQVCDGPLTTNDMARLSADGRFCILGRRDNVICSGGKKIQAEEIEQLLARHTDVPLMVTHRPDPRLGQAVVLIAQTTDVAPLRQLCRRLLPRHEQPRLYIATDHLPLTPNGKPARHEARLMALIHPQD